MGWVDCVVPACSRVPWVVTCIVAACGDDATQTSGSEAASSSAATDGASLGEPESSGPVDGTTSSDGGVDTTDDSSTGVPDVDPGLADAGISAGFEFTCSVREGVLSCWGAGACGRLGDGTDYGKASVAIATDRTWTSVALGSEHACAIEDDRSLWCWGDAAGGRIGDGQLDDPLDLDCRLEPVKIAVGASWARVATGDVHTCGVQTDGTLWCWGTNDVGQIGDGSVGDLYTRIVPTEVGGDDWIDVFAGNAHSCGLRSDSTVWCWGHGAALGLEGVPFSSTPVELALPAAIRALGRGGGSSSHTCAIDVDDGLWCWGDNDAGKLGDPDALGVVPIEVPLGGAVAEVATHAHTTCARRTDGALWCFGRGSSGQLADGIAEPTHSSAMPVEVEPGTSFTSVAVGPTHVCARRDDGTELCWGSNDGGQIGDGTSGPDNDRLQPTVAMPWGGGPIATGWSAVALGQSHGCGTRNGGELWCSGNRRNGALGNDDLAEDCSDANPIDCVVTTPVAVASTSSWGTPTLGWRYGCAIRDDGTAWCWGDNEQGQLGTAGDGVVVPVQVGLANDWIVIEAEGKTTCGIRSPGTLWCWGDNFSGQLGQGEVGVDSPTPLRVGGDADWTDVEISSVGHVCGLRAGGTLWCWGRNEEGALGLGVQGDPVPDPTLVPGAWSTVATGPYHTCAIADDGTLWCWGANLDGGLGPDAGDGSPQPLQFEADADWIAVTAGSSTCGRRSDGTAWCWGRNHSGQVGNGRVERDEIVTEATMVADIDDWIALEAGGDAVCGVRSDGTALCWGNNHFGQQGNDTIFISGVAREVRDDG